MRAPYRLSAEPLRVSHSELQLWTRCRRKWYITHYLGYGTDPAAALPFGWAPLGTRIHTALEANYGYNLSAPSVLDYLYKDALHARPECEQELKKEQELAQIMIAGFLEWAASEGFDMGYEVVATEQEVAVPIPLPGGSELILVAKLDAIIRRLEDGALLFRDWKTVGTLSKANGLIRNTQMRTYALIQALRARGNPAVPRVDGGQYVMLLRSQRTARAKGPFYSKVDLPSYNRNDLNSTWLRVRQIGSEIQRARHLLDNGADHRTVCYPTPIDDRCDWECQFADICPLFDDGSRWEDALNGNFAHIDPYQRYTSTVMRDILHAFRPQAQEQE